MQDLANCVKETRSKVDDYRDTVHAIVSFANLFRLDPSSYQRMPAVSTFQGRRLTAARAAPGNDDVFPDVGIVDSEEHGVLGEVKKNFPKEEYPSARAQRVFDQLLQYDRALEGWPTTSETVIDHEIVLLTHVTVASHAAEYCTTSQQDGINTFERPFSIVQFARMSQGDEFFFLQTKLGPLRKLPGGQDLLHGIPVPMRVLLTQYAKVALYDGEPPVAYLAYLIWRHLIVQRAAEDPRFGKLRKNQTLAVRISVDEAVNELQEGFTFKYWHQEYGTRQRTVPKTQWVKNAFEFLVKADEAAWLNTTHRTHLEVRFRKYDDEWQHFLNAWCAMEVPLQVQPLLPLIEDSDGSGGCEAADNHA